MKLLTALFFSMSLMTASIVSAQPPGCHCPDCVCTPEAHCGCYASDVGCKCMNGQCVINVTNPEG